MQRRARHSAAIPLLGLAVAFAAAACLPIPHTVTLSPGIDGHLTDAGGAPVAGARVVVSTALHDSTCTRPAVTATTAADGSFTLAAVKNREGFVLLLPMDRTFCYTVCTAAGNGALRGGYDACPLHRVPSRLTLDCVQAAEPGQEPRIACVERRPGGSAG